MSLVTDALRSLGAPERVVVAVIILLIGWQLYKLVGVARLVSALLSSGVGYLFVLLGAGALAVGLGWVRVDTAVSELQAAGGSAWKLVVDPLLSGGDVVESVVDGLRGLVGL